MKNPPYKKMVRKLGNYAISEMSSGGKVRGGGVEKRGKTKGRFV